MKLTKRQEEFVQSLLDLYGELQEPFHYSELAERLGVSRFTAYDMLRVLEEKGIVASRYQLDEERSGPGRSVVVYEPTPRARRMLAHIFGERGRGDWQALAARLLDQVQRGELGDADLAREMLARTPPDEPPALRYCIEVMTVAALRLQRQAARQHLLQQAHSLLASGEHNCRTALALLGGFALGVLGVDENDDAHWREELQAHLWQYETLVISMDAAACTRLLERLRELFAPLSTT